MGNIFNDDFSDFIQSLNDNEVAYILVGVRSYPAWPFKGYQRYAYLGGPN